MSLNDRHSAWAARLARRAAIVDDATAFYAAGSLRRVVGQTIEADGCVASLGAACDIIEADGRRIETEVVGFAEDRLFLIPTSQVGQIAPSASVVPRAAHKRQRIDERILGRVINGHGAPLDGGGPVDGDDELAPRASVRNPLSRAPIDTPLDVGVRAINAVLTLGRGQRVGLFAGSGVGKSTLLGMMTRHTAADVVVVGLIGERGREVGEFVHETLGRDGLSRAVVVATPADETPLMRINGAWLATRVAEYFRDRGASVLLLMDSLTRFAQAQREIGLAIGEPPTTKGYPPSVFSLLPQLIERAGNGAAGQGSITAVYTVLAEGDDPNDPIVDAARAILDGHLVLSRSVAESGVYPALDVERSISRAAHRLVSAEHQAKVAEFRELIAAYQQNADLIRIGAYQPGADPIIDRSLQIFPRVRQFLSQGLNEAVSLAESTAALHDMLAFQGTEILSGASQ
ncbi:MAG: FliI/YscN family ATPase [Pseudomonadota bacterium]